METIINDKLRPAPAADNITSLTLLRVIVEAFRELSGVDLTNLLDQMASELVMCLCHCELLNTSVSISHTLLTNSTSSHSLLVVLLLTNKLQ